VNTCGLLVISRRIARKSPEAASRAIYQCAPYDNLPAKRYDEWHEINPFHFDPRQMMNQ